MSKQSTLQTLQDIELPQSVIESYARCILRRTPCSAAPDFVSCRSCFSFRRSAFSPWRGARLSEPPPLWQGPLSVWGGVGASGESSCATTSIHSLPGIPRARLP